MSSRARLKLTESRRRSFAPLPSHGPYIFSCHFERQWHEGSSQAQSHFPILYFNGGRLRLPARNTYFGRCPSMGYEWGGGLHVRLVRLHPVALSSFCHLVRRVVPLGWRRITRADWFAFFSSIHRVTSPFAMCMLPIGLLLDENFLTHCLPLFLVVLHVSWSDTVSVPDSGLLCLLVLSRSGGAYGSLTVRYLARKSSARVSKPGTKDGKP
ncbi:hypothetical protein BSL78_19388 [Apostichopus japonicus]|uniref:Uncharacterized protein n=1 Tax=Stichopus japonicus TaxID=307972 RepID=A0A2G8K733_STIJA|nr:hypothetical protein BSL78_19388 [Apostichopus japonicus]